MKNWASRKGAQFFSSQYTLFWSRGTAFAKVVRTYINTMIRYSISLLITSGMNLPV